MVGKKIFRLSLSHADGYSLTSGRALVNNLRQRDLYSDSLRYLIVNSDDDNQNHLERFGYAKESSYDPFFQLSYGDIKDEDELSKKIDYSFEAFKKPAVAIYDPEKFHKKFKDEKLLPNDLDRALVVAYLLIQ